MKNVITIRYLIAIISFSFVLLIPQISQAKTALSFPLPESGNSSAPFITEWAVDTSAVITIPLQNGTYDFTFVWTNLLDTTQISGTHTDTDGNFTTNFNRPGVYQLQIVGEFPHLRGYPVDQLLDVLQWGDIEWRSMAESFQNWPGASFTATDAPDLSQVTNMIRMFRNAPNFNEDLDHWDVSAIKNMQSLFSGATAFNGNICNWDVSNVTTMKEMFRSAAIFNQDIGGWNVEKVTNMEDMFRQTAIFNQDISGWDVSSVTNMRQMFDNADSFNQPIGKWDVRNNLSFREMFRQNDAFNQSLGNWQFNPNANFLNVFGGASGMDCQAWSSTILGWNFSNPELENIPIGGPNVEYDSIADRARDELLARGWSISGTLVEGNCEAVHQFRCSDTITVANDTLFGDLIIAAAEVVALDTVVVDTLGATTATAGENITLSTGFHALAGSNFTARIEASPCSNDLNLVNTLVQSRSEEEPEEKLEDQTIIRTQVVEKMTLQLAPNPTSGPLQLKLESQMRGQAMLQIINLNGQLVHRAQFNVFEGTTINELDVTHLPAGTYFVLVQSVKGVVQTKFVKI